MIIEIKTLLANVLIAPRG